MSDKKHQSTKAGRGIKLSGKGIPVDSISGSIGLGTVEAVIFLVALLAFKKK